MGTTRSRYQFLVTFGTLIGLLIGFTLGALAFETNHWILLSIGSFLKPVGTFWVNALRMIILPLISSYLFLSVAATRNAARTGKIGICAMACFVVLLGGAVIFSLLLGPPLFDQISIDPSTRQVLDSFSDSDLNSVQFNQLEADDWITHLIPTNLVEAAAQDRFLSIIVATLLFGLAVRRIQGERRRILIDIARAISETTLVLVGWLLKLMPLGVLALTYVIAQQSGFSFAGALGYCVIFESAMVFAFTVLVYLLPVFVGRIPLRLFSWGIFPAQLVAVSTRSSLATLPSLMACAQNRLQLDTEVSGLVLPLSVSVFKLDVAITSFTGLFFLTNLHNIELTAGQLAVFAGGAILFSFSAPGIPTGGFPYQTPLYMAVGIPIESCLILSAIGTIPDLFQTLLNVTADISTASVVNRFFGKNPI